MEYATTTTLLHVHTHMYVVYGSPPGGSGIRVPTFVVPSKLVVSKGP